LGRDKIEDKLRKISFYIEIGDFKKASELLSEISDAIPCCSQEDALKILEFLDFYSKKLKNLERSLILETNNKMKVRKSYFK